MGQLSHKLIYPIISAQIHLHRALLRSKIIKKRSLVLLLVAPFLAILIAFGDLIILNLYDTRYAPGSWMLPILAIGLWPRVLSYTIDPVFLALGKPKYTAYGNLMVFLVLVIGVPITFYFSHIVFVVVLISAKELMSYIVVYYGLWKEKMAAPGQDFISTLFLLVLVVLILVTREFLGLGSSFGLVL